MPSILARTQQLLKPFSAGGGRQCRARLINLFPARDTADLDALSKRIILPSLPVADEDMTRLSISEHGRKLARQECWSDLSHLIQLADDARLSTPGGVPEAILLVMGAHDDVVAAATDELEDGRVPAPDGLNALDAVTQDETAEPGHGYPLALVAALAHLRIARAWLALETPPAGECAATHASGHFTAARDLLAPYDAGALDAPSLAVAQCALAEAPDAGPETVIAAHAQLIRLDPDSPQHMRAFGALLLPSRFGTHAMLEETARRLSEETADIWGQGGYVWVWMDALAASPEALAHVDVAMFTQGLKDILHRTRNQHLVNELAAFCAIEMAADDSAPALPRKAERARAALHGCMGWILSRHLHELHPHIWAGARPPGTAAPRPAAHRALVAEGRRTALRVIAGCFADQLSDGSTIAFSPAGMYRLPAV